MGRAHEISLRLTKQSQERTAEKREVQRQQEEKEAAELAKNPPVKKTIRGKDSGQLVSVVQLELFSLHAKGVLNFRAMNHPENKLPRTLSRLPIFMASSRSAQQKRLDTNNSIPFVTGFGVGRRYGANLTIQDESVFFALVRLRTASLKGHGSTFPVKVYEAEREKMRLLGIKQSEQDFTVYTTICTVADIIDAMGLVRSGNNHKRVLESLERINSTSIQLTQVNQKGVEVTFKFNLVDMITSKYQEDGVIYCQFNPIVSSSLAQQFVYIDPELRSRINTDVGKAIYRFLSTQPNTYQIGLSKLADIIGYLRPLSQFRRDVVNTCNQLVELGWMISFNIEGKGRSKGYKLQIHRASSKKGGGSVIDQAGKPVHIEHDAEQLSLMDSET